jgi:RHS repeat-associated protein
MYSRSVTGNGSDLNGQSAIKNPYMFTARRFEEETGLYHYRRRAYDPECGRFLQRDPLGYVDGSNLYEHVASSPTVGRDPMGLRRVTDADRRKYKESWEPWVKWNRKRKDIESQVNKWKAKVRELKVKVAAKEAELVKVRADIAKVEADLALLGEWKDKGYTHLRFTKGEREKDVSIAKLMEHLNGLLQRLKAKEIILEVELSKLEMELQMAETELELWEGKHRAHMSTEPNPSDDDVWTWLLAMEGVGTPRPESEIQESTAFDDYTAAFLRRMFYNQVLRPIFEAGGRPLPGDRTDVYFDVHMKKWRLYHSEVRSNAPYHETFNPCSTTHK